MKGASVNGVAVNLVSQLALFGLRFAYQIAIARLLLPGDFGLVAMSAPVIAFAGMFADLGLSQATIQQKEISQAQLSFLFWLNVVTSLLLAGVCVCASGLIADFYGDPRVADVLIVSGSLLFVGGLYSQHMALLNRQMRFRSMAVVNLVGFSSGAAAGIVSALLGMGYWAIVLNQVAASLTALVLTWSLCRWMPGRPGPLASMGQLLQFSGDIVAFRFANFFSRSSDSILLGRFAGEHALGLYDRAIKLMLLPFGQISGPFTSVAIPLLSRTEDQPELYRRAYSRMLEAVLLLIYPGLIFMIANSHELVFMALGPAWIEVVPIFVILGVDAFVAPIGNSVGWLFVSQNRTREMRNWGMLTSMLFVACFAIGLLWGPRGVAGGYAAAGVIEILLLCRVVTRKGPLRGRDLLALITPFLFGVAVTFAVVYGLRSILPSGAAGLCLQAVCAYVGFVASLAVLPRGRGVLHNVAQQVRELVTRVVRGRDKNAWSVRDGVI